MNIFTSIIWDKNKNKYAEYTYIAGKFNRNIQFFVLKYFLPAAQGA